MAMALSANRASCVKIGLEAFDCPVRSRDLNASEHFKDERQPRPSRLTSVPNCMKTLVTE